MAEILKTYLDQAGAQHLVEKLDARETEKDTAVLKSAKEYSDSLSTNYDPSGTAATKVKELADGAVKDNTDAIAKLNGADTVDGSVAKTVKDAKTELEKKITDSIYDDSEVKASIKANADAIQAHKDAVDAKVTTLVGDDADKSVRTIANEELAAQLLTGKADADFKTLKELAAWLEDHPEEVATINASIAEIKKLIGTIPEGATATDIVGYIKEAVKAEETRATGVEAGLDTRVAAVEALVGEGGSVDDKIATAKQEAIDAAATDATTKAGTAETNAKAYADSLASNYATAAQGAKADSALQKADIVTGTANGTIAVGGEDVAVKGLGSAAYELKTAFEAAGSVQALADGQVATNKTDIAALRTDVDALKDVNFTAITNEQIDAWFTKAE